MKKQLILTAIAMMLMCVCAQAQNSTEGTLWLRNGNQITGTIEMQADGSAKVVTAAGDTFYFTASEIAGDDNAASKKGGKKNKANRQEEVRQVYVPQWNVVPGMKYSEYKNLYSARNYVFQPGDTYSPGLVTALSALFPGVGQACVGRWGSAFAFAFLDGVGAGLIGASSFDGYYHVEMVCAGIGVMALSRIWSAWNVNKVAKIKNLYLRDIRDLSAVQFNLEPYVGQIGTLAMQPQPFAGLTLRMSF